MCKCSAALRSNIVPKRCSVCSKGFHQKCSTGPKASTHYRLWKCEKSKNFRQNHTSESIDCQLPGSTNSFPSQPLLTASGNKLRVYQWNANGIRPRLTELRDLLINSDIDVFGRSGIETTKNWQNPIHWRLRYNPQRLTQHPWRWASDFHSNWHRVWETSICQKSWYEDPVHPSQGY